VLDHLPFLLSNPAIPHLRILMSATEIFGRDTTLTPAVFTLFKSRVAFQYMEVASIALVVYDYLLTIDDEIDLIWKRTKNLSSVLFFFTRYLPFIDGVVTLLEAVFPNPPASVCRTLVGFRVWLYLFSLIIVQSILVQRTTAIWGQSDKIGSSLFVFMMICFAGMGFIGEQFLESLVFGPSPNPATISGCIKTASSRTIWISYLILTILETVIFVLTTFKAARQERCKRSPLFIRIYHDGAFIYGCVCVISVINIMVINFAPADGSNAFNGLHRVLHAILAERLVLRIKRAMNDSQT